MTGKDAALAQFALDFKFAVVADHHVFDDGQTQAGAAGFGDAAIVRAVEAFGEARDVGRVDADAVVAHRQVRATLILPPADVDLAASGGVLCLLYTSPSPRD